MINLYLNDYFFIDNIVLLTYFNNWKRVSTCIE